jgi:hypothetical protein
MAGGDKSRPVTRALTLALAFVLLVFVVQVVGHSHEKGKREATCQVCQAARVGSDPHSGAFWTQIHLRHVATLEPFVLMFHQVLCFHDSPSRAPPSVVQ